MAGYPPLAEARAPAEAQCASSAHEATSRSDEAEARSALSARRVRCGRRTNVGMTAISNSVRCRGFQRATSLMTCKSAVLLQSTRVRRHAPRGGVLFAPRPLAVLAVLAGRRGNLQQREELFDALSSTGPSAQP